MADYRIDFYFMPSDDEELTLGFPLFVIDADLGFYGARITDLRVEIDGEEIPTETERVWYERSWTDWAVYQVSFQKDKPLHMVVSYSLEARPFGKTPAADLWIAYVLRTGSFWADTIGRVDALLRFDRPIRLEDIRTEQHNRGTTPGWTLTDGEMHWEWVDVEPDFDLSVQVANPFWLDAPDDIRKLLNEGVQDRHELLSIAHGMTVFFAGDGRSGSWMQVRGGVSSELAGEPLLLEVLSLLDEHIANNPTDWEAWQSYLSLLYYSAYHTAVGHEVLLSEERLRTWVFEMHQYREAGGPDDFYLLNWQPWTRQVISEVGLSKGTQEAIVSWLLSGLPDRFATESQAEAWVQSQSGTVLAEDLYGVLLEEALSRVAAAPAPVPTPQSPLTAESNPRPELYQEEESESVPDPKREEGAEPALSAQPADKGVSVWFPWFAGIALSGLGIGALLYRRRLRNTL